MKADTQVTVPLGISDVRVLKTEITERGDLIITVESTKGGVACRRCGQRVTMFQGHDDWVTVRHLPVFGRPTYLHYRPKRYRCEACEGQPTTTERLEWVKSNSPHSIAYDEHVLLELVNATIEDVSVREGLNYKAVLGVIERCIRAQVDWSEYTTLGVLGLDEIALKKGHRDFVVIVTARLPTGRVVILGVLPDRLKDTVVAFLRSIPEHVRKTIHTVCTDMYDGYIEAVRIVLPTAQIVVDRFHVTEKYHEAADVMRKQELKRLKAELPEEDYKSLKGNLWAFRKKPENLRPEERQVLERLFSLAPKLKLAYAFRQQLTDIFEEQLSKEAAQLKIQAWIKEVQASGLKCFDDFLKTLMNWWEEVTNYFVNRANSGFIEGLNNKLKVLKRRCYGIYNLKHLFQRIYLDLEGYRLFAG